MLRRLLSRLFTRPPAAGGAPVADPEQAARPLQGGAHPGRQARVHEPPPPRPEGLRDEEVDLPVVEEGEWRGE